MAIILQEALRGLFYAPFYVALARDAFSAEGVEIRFTSSPHPNETALRVMDGTVDVSWGGPMRVMETYHKLAGCDLVCFGEVVTRDPFLLMGRTPRPDFSLADLMSVELATVSEVPTPWLCLQHDLRLAGIDPAGIRRVTGRTMAENMAALKAGTVDVIQVFEPFPSLLLAEGGAHVWYEAARRAPPLTPASTRGAARWRRGATSSAPGAGDRPHREVGGEGQRSRDRQRDRRLLRRCARSDPRGGLHALQGARHLGHDADPAARRLRPAARRAGVRRLRLARRHVRDAVDNTLAEDVIALDLPALA